jgi:photosystem II stability/assembly factor-like uncharacterized protein
MRPFPSMRRLATAIPLLFAFNAGVSHGAEMSDINLLATTSSVLVRPASAVLLSVSSAGKRLVACGEGGVVVISDDDGQTWKQVAMPVSVALTRVRFTTSGTGWILGHGGVVLRSDDQGTSWRLVMTGVQAAQIELDAAKAETKAGQRDAQKYLAAAEALVADGPDKPLFDIYFSDANTGILIGAFGLLYGSTDGGKTWESWRERLSNPQGKHLYEVQPHGDSFFIVGEQGAVYQSTDHLKTFKERKTPYVGTYFGALSKGDKLFLAYGLRGNAFASHDLGATWKKIDLGQPITVTSGTRLEDGRLVLVDESGRVLVSDVDWEKFKAIELPQRFPFVGVTQNKAGGITLAGVRGVMTISREKLVVDSK